MFKRIIKNQALTLYLATNLLIVVDFLIYFFAKLLNAEELTCHARGFGSGAGKVCDAIEYFYENGFWHFLVVIIFQSFLIPAAIITYFLSRIIINKIQTKYKDRLWFKYILALSIYLAAGLAMVIILGKL
jgi:hypothetical protein